MIRFPIKNRGLMVTKIISGGQTGVDRAALDVAMNSDCRAEGGVPVAGVPRTDVCRIIIRSWKLRQHPIASERG